MRRSPVLLVAMLVGVAALGGCRGDSAGPHTYVGAVAGTQALVAVRVEGAGVHAFFCDSNSLWGALDGTLAGTTLSATAGTDVLSGTLGSDSVTGSLSIDGTAHSFVAPLATGDAGAFMAEHRTGDRVETTAWVRDAAGTVTGVKVITDLAPLKTLPQFSAAELKTIDDILRTGIVPGAPTSGVPAGAQPLSFGSAISCGIAAFKYRRYRLQCPMCCDPREVASKCVDLRNDLEGACGIDVTP